MTPTPPAPEPDPTPSRIETWKVSLGIACAFLVVVAVAFGLGRCSAPDPVEPVIVPEVDAGPGEAAIAARLDAAVQREDERLAALEREHAAEVDALADAERREYEARRAQGRTALAAWFKERTRRLLSDAGVTR